jgi:hypothetical protein
MADEPQDQGNAEAAKWRRQLREAEAERDALRARLDDTHRVMVETEAAVRFVEPRDVWALTSIDALRGDDGLVDLERVQAEFDRIEQDRPHWRKQPEPEPQPNGFPEMHQGARATPEPPPPSFGNQLQRAVRR